VRGRLAAAAIRIEPAAAPKVATGRPSAFFVLFSTESQEYVEKSRFYPLARNVFSAIML
jgi:hypothetical protein